MHTWWSNSSRMACIDKKYRSEDWMKVNRLPTVFWSRLSGFWNNRHTTALVQQYALSYLNHFFPVWCSIHEGNMDITFRLWLGLLICINHANTDVSEGGRFLNKAHGVNFPGGSICGIRFLNIAHYFFFSWCSMCMWQKMSKYSTYRWLRTRRALMLFKDVPFRTRRALLP